MNPRIKRGIIVFFVFIFIVLILRFLSTNYSTHRYFVNVGQEATLDSGSALVPVATTLDAFDAWVKAQVANDSYGRTALFASGNVFGVNNGTKALVIDEASLRRKVRILDGEKKGRSGWVAIDYLK